MPEEESTRSTAASKFVYIRGEEKALGWRICLPSQPWRPSPISSPSCPHQNIEDCLAEVTDHHCL